MAKPPRLSFLGPGDALKSALERIQRAGLDGLPVIEDGRLDATPFATHHFGLDQPLEAYDTFAAAGETNALKVVLAGEHAYGSARAAELVGAAL